MKKMSISLLLMVLFLASCTDGTQANVKSSCNSSKRTGTCTVTLVSLADGAYWYEINNDEFWPGANSVKVAVQVEVQKGAVLVWIEDPQAESISVTVEPGQVGEIQGKAWLHVISDKRRFFVYFEPIGDAELVENVTATIQYDMP